MVVILAEVDKVGAQQMAERITKLIEETPFTANGKPVAFPITTVSATYPDEGLTEEELLQVTERRLSRPDHPKTRIMVIDDEPKIRQFLKEILELQEYEVHTAASGPDALEQLKSHKVDLVLLDLMMPVMSGYEVYHLLKESPETKQVSVIMVTGKGERKDRQLGLESAPYNYVEKPFQVEDLLAKVRDVLLHRQSVSS